MSVEAGTCRYGAKRTFGSKEAATAGTQDIRARVEAAGRVYTTLYPYACPDGDHWHLSHYPQGTATCPVCGREAPAWNGGKVWVISAHDHDSTTCAGMGKPAVAA